MEKEQITPERIRKVIREVMNEISSERKAPAAKGSERTALEGRVSAGKWSERTVSERRVSAGKGSERKAPATSVKQAPQKTPCSVAVGADHGGFKLKESLKKYLEEELEVIVKDFGTQSEESVDYPDFAIAVARAVGAGECEKGIVIDTMGIGSSIAANKVKGVRAALCHDVLTARNSRGHNDANVLALGSKVVNPGLARTIVRAWLSTSFEGGRHGRRVQKIIDAEKG